MFNLSPYHPHGHAQDPQSRQQFDKRPPCAAVAHQTLLGFGPHTHSFADQIELDKKRIPCVFDRVVLIFRIRVSEPGFELPVHVLGWPCEERVAVFVIYSCQPHELVRLHAAPPPAGVGSQRPTRCSRRQLKIRPPLRGSPARRGPGFFVCFFFAC